MASRERPATAFTEDQLGLILIGMERAGIKGKADLARALCLEPQTVYKWFDGQRGASREVREALCDLLKLPVDRFIGTDLGANGALEEVSAAEALSNRQLASQLIRLAEALLRGERGEDGDFTNHNCDADGLAALAFAPRATPVYATG